MSSDFIRTADASQVSGADFARSLGLKIRTKEEKLAEWEAGVARYIQLIRKGCDLDSFGNPQVSEAKKRIAEAEQTILGHTADEWTVEVKELPNGHWRAVA
jgi:hypothetical protein